MKDTKDRKDVTFFNYNEKYKFHQTFKDLISSVKHSPKHANNPEPQIDGNHHTFD